VEGCNWFTYNSKKNACLALSTCPNVVEEGCPECLSGQVILIQKNNVFLHLIKVTIQKDLSSGNVTESQTWKNIVIS
jgi:hypothetical protein